MTRKHAQEDEGAAAVEFALVSILLVMLIAGMVSIVFLYQIQISVTHAAREGVRLASVGRYDSQVVRDRSGVPDPDNLNLAVEAVEDEGSGEGVRVTASYPITIELPSWVEPVGVEVTRTLFTPTSSAVMRIESVD